MSEVKILLIGDKVSENTDTLNILNSLDYEVSKMTSDLEEFSSPDTALDLILVDGSSSSKIDPKLTSKLEESKTPVIFITQPSEESELGQLKLKQPHDHLIMPFTPRELKYAIEFLVYKNNTEKKLNETGKNSTLPFNIPYHSLDQEGTIVDVNTAWLNLLGYSREEVIGKNITNFTVSESSKNFEKIFKNFKSVGEIHGAEFEMKKSEGSHIPVSCDAIMAYDGQNSFKQTHWIFQNVTKINEYEEKLKQISHIYSTINQINQSIFRIKNKEELFQTFCDVIVEYGKFEMAWVGLIDFETGDIKPVACSGNESGYLKTVPLNIHKNPSLLKSWLNKLDQESLGVAGEIEKFKNFEWREQAIKRGYRSLMSIPIRREEEIIGTLNIYSSKPDFYQNKEIDLVNKIGLDLSFGLKVIETEENKKLAEDALKRSEKNYRDLVDNSLIGIYKTTVNGEILFANQAVADLFKYDTVEELKTHNIIDVYKNKEDRAEFLAVLKEKGKIARCERENFRKDGQIVNILSSASLDGDVISGMFMDITDRKQVEDKFHSIINNSADLFIIVDNERRITFCSPSSKRILGYSPEFLTGKDPSDFIHRDDVHIFKDHMEDVHKTQNVILFSE